MSGPKEDIKLINCSFMDNAEGLQRRINNLQKFGQEILNEMCGIMV